MIEEVDSDLDQPFEPADWIGVGKVYRDVPKHVATACKAARGLPTSVIRQLPMPDMAVTEFLDFPLQTILDDDAPFPKRSSLWFSPDPPNCGEDTVRFIASIPPLDFVRQLENDFSQAWLNGTCSIVDHTDPSRRLPLWTPAFFREVITLHAAKEQWKESRSWLPQAEEHLLDFVSWNSVWSPGAPDGQLDWTRLVSNEWLSGGIIDEMMRDINTRISEDPMLASTTFVAPLVFQYYVTQFALHGTERRYFDQILAEVAAGKTTMLFPIHYNRNHWMAFVINFGMRTLGFGTAQQGSHRTRHSWHAI
jgi:hypothetical protein